MLFRDIESNLYEILYIRYFISIYYPEDETLIRIEILIILIILKKNLKFKSIPAAHLTS